MAITILRTYYNFCQPFKSFGEELTPAQGIGIADRAYSSDWAVFYKQKHHNMRCNLIYILLYNFSCKFRFCDRKRNPLINFGSIFNLVIMREIKLLLCLTDIARVLSFRYLFPEPSCFSYRKSTLGCSKKQYVECF